MTYIKYCFINKALWLFWSKVPPESGMSPKLNQLLLDLSSTFSLLKKKWVFENFLLYFAKKHRLSRNLDSQNLIPVCCVYVFASPTHHIHIKRWFCVTQPWIEPNVFTHIASALAVIDCPKGPFRCFFPYKIYLQLVIDQLNHHN